ncbi:L-aspartate oxidase [Cyanobium sp. HWJ4-Hawea]|uniref:L-aspartate oxidase n=1 Tax=Cyanobium sp. HWJ4-Hawea TaxID=2823713 RepID=UPI0020CC1279|nr:L-aspartate oxidase [Cyanobium sp. HWJ4-Hawea]MCP9809830.1 L-aspartate oxidase [Cyanobium sp. HWJ4-Hawea]
MAGNWDVVVVGSGAAGLMACLELPPQLRVLLLSKDSAPRSASRWAQGGIASVTRPEDSFTSHIEDTLRAGAGLCDQPAVELLVHQAPGCVRRLLEIGMAFDRDGPALSTTLEAAHSHRRVLHAQDRTGGALVEALEREVQGRDGLEQRRGVAALGLWMEQGRCVGLQVMEAGQIHWLRAGAVVLATGGGGHLFVHTTNPAMACGDGVVMAWQAGAELRDMEFVQFHPTALMLPGAPRFLISEAVRGEGAHLLDGQGCSPVADLPGGDLAPRDQVSRALARTMREQGVDHLWLDLRPVGKQRLEQQFPTILGRCRELGLEPTEGPIPVAPAAHYWMGGIFTDHEAATSVPGLYAVGEVACTGIHGANRLASNSLMECLVFARQLRLLKLEPQAPITADQLGLDYRQDRELALDLPPIEVLEQAIGELRELCWWAAGVERCRRDLAPSLGRIRQQRRALEQDPNWQRFSSLNAGGEVGLKSGSAIGPVLGPELEPELGKRFLTWHELHQRLVLAELVMEAALFREESRGGHFRTDAPASQPFWRRHSIQKRGPAGGGEHHIGTTPVDQPA